VFIPVTYPNAQTVTNFYIGYQVVNSTTGFKSLAYVEPMLSVTVASSTASNWAAVGPMVSTNTVGDIVTNLQIKANSPIALTTNSGNSIGSAVTYFSEWDYFSDSTVTGFESYGKCTVMRYLYYTTNYAAYLTGSTFAYNYKCMKGVVCTCDLGGAVTGLALTLSKGYIPSKWGMAIPGSGAVSDNTGRLRYLGANFQNVGITPILTGVTFPGVGPNMKKAVGVFSMVLPVSLDQSTQI
jgi:hypothetical protein